MFYPWAMIPSPFSPPPPTNNMGSPSSPQLQAYILPLSKGLSFLLPTGEDPCQGHIWAAWLLQAIRFQERGWLRVISQHALCKTATTFSYQYIIWFKIILQTICTAILKRSSDEVTLVLLSCQRINHRFSVHVTMVLLLTYLRIAAITTSRE